MKILLHSYNDARPLGSSADLRETPNSVLPGSVITPGSTRCVPFHAVRPVASPRRSESWRRSAVRPLMAKAA